MSVLARRSIPADPTDDVVALWSRKSADFAALSGALDDRLSKLADLKAELAPMLAIASTIDQANALVADARGKAAEIEAAGTARSTDLDAREATLSASEAQFKARSQVLADEETAQASERAGLESDKAAQQEALDRRTVDVAARESQLDDDRAQLAADRAALAADRKEVNRLLAKLQQPD